MSDRSSCAHCGQGFEKVRIGTDIMLVESVTESLRTFGSRYLHRIYTHAEIEYCERSLIDMPRRLAARFAAKEACLKILRPFQHWLDWRSIEVVKTPGGWCELKLRDKALQLAVEQGVHNLSVSLSHEEAYAVAVVAATLSPGSAANPGGCDLRTLAVPRLPH